MYYNGCFFTKNPWQTLSGIILSGSETNQTVAVPKACFREETCGSRQSELKGLLDSLHLPRELLCACVEFFIECLPQKLEIHR